MPDEFQTEEQFEPEQRMVIKDLDTLKAISDPLRLQIVEHMLAGARTVKQLAQELNTTPTKLYYHINMLEQYGLIKVTGTRVVSGIIEKQYHVAAYSIDIESRCSLLPCPVGNRTKTWTGCSQQCSTAS